MYLWWQPSADLLLLSLSFRGLFCALKYIVCEGAREYVCMCVCVWFLVSGVSSDDFCDTQGLQTAAMIPSLPPSILKIPPGDPGENQSPHPIEVDQAALNYFKRAQWWDFSGSIRLKSSLVFLHALNIRLFGPRTHCTYTHRLRTHSPSDWPNPGISSMTGEEAFTELLENERRSWEAPDRAREAVCVCVWTSTKIRSIFGERAAHNDNLLQRRWEGTAVLTELGLQCMNLYDVKWCLQLFCNLLGLKCSQMQRQSLEYCHYE